MTVRGAARIPGGQIDPNGHGLDALTIDDLIAEDDRVTIRWTLHGTNTGPMLGRPPTGQPVELAAIVIFRIADGKIAERWAAWKPGRAPFST
jgi:hypothetical protein